jgi:hypothetical protein
MGFFHTATVIGHLPAPVGNLSTDPAQFAVVLDVPGYGKVVHSFHLLHKTANGTLAARVHHGNGTLRLQGELAASTASPCAGGFTFENGTGSYMLDMVPNNTSMGTVVTGRLQWTAFDASSWPFKQKSEGCLGCVLLPEAALPDVIAFDSLYNQTGTVNATGSVGIYMSLPVCNDTVSWDGVSFSAPIHANIQHITIIKHTGLVSMTLSVSQNQTGMATLAASWNGRSLDSFFNNCSSEVVAQTGGMTLASWQAFQANNLLAKELLQLLINSTQGLGEVKFTFALPPYNLEMTVQVG